MKRFFVVLAAAVVVCAPGFSAEQESRGKTLRLTMREAIQRALEKDFSLEIERFEPLLAREDLRRALGGFDPVLELALDHTQSPNGAGDLSRDTAFSATVSGLTPVGLRYRAGVESAYDTGPAGKDGLSTAAIFSLTQPLLRGAGADANLSSIRIARLRGASSEWGLKQRVMEIITEVIRVYNELNFARENLQVAERNRELARQLVRDNTARVTIGTMAPLDITTAQAQAASREEGVLKAEREVRDQENALKRLITGELTSLLDTQLDLEAPPVPGFVPDVRGGLREAVVSRPEFQQAKISLQQRNVLLAFAKDDALPQLDVQATLRQSGLDDGVRAGSAQGTRWSVGATFSVPIPNQAARARVNTEKLLLAQSLLELKRLEQDIVIEVDNTSGRVVTARERIDANREATRLARESLLAGESSLAAGKGTTFEVLELQKRLSEAEVAELRSKTDFAQNVARYHLACGTTLREHGVKVEEDKPGKSKRR